ncbi:MAG: hypothetical protein WAQ53_06320 [Thiofilum sp.]|uniref:hypothetical protein n=1 Tax=Thiofilum sp. TaxID=2212733 RepID=UPI0025D81EB0|nr:hypothetical protein [Thiofilum sp.]MBK8454949.1 hypothetical protein [Thiofilum sp.]
MGWWEAASDLAKMFDKEVDYKTAGKTIYRDHPYLQSWSHYEWVIIKRRDGLKIPEEYNWEDPFSGHCNVYGIVKEINRICESKHWHEGVGHWEYRYDGVELWIKLTDVR